MLVDASHSGVPGRRAVPAALLISVLLVLCTPTSTGASVDVGGLPRSPADAWPVVPAGTYRPPVDAVVIDPFRAPATPWGPGNRGLEYATLLGSPVRAIGAGEVVFAGPVAGRLAVTVLHADGRRSSYSDLASVEVRFGDLLPRGAVVGHAGRTLHLGLREGDRYVDPAEFLDRRRAVLVPHRPLQRVSARPARPARVVRRSEIGPMPSSTTARPPTSAR